jgi:hypothetical protein
MVAMKNEKTKNGVVIDEATRHFVIAAFVIAEKAKLIKLPKDGWEGLTLKLTMNDVELPLTETCNRYFSDIDRRVDEEASKRLGELLKDSEYLREQSEELAKKFAEIQGKLENAEKDEYDRVTKEIDSLTELAKDGDDGEG